MPGQGQRGGQPGAQRQRLHTHTLPTVAAPQRHITRGLLTTLHMLTDPHSHTHSGPGRAVRRQDTVIQFGHEDRDFTCVDSGTEEGDGWDGTTSARDQREECL